MRKKLEKILRIAITGGLVVAVAIAMSGLLTVEEVSAAALTSKSDIMTRVQADTNANHTIEFTTPTGVAAAETITVTFPGTWDLTLIDFEDMDLEDDSTDITLAAVCSGATWGAAVAGQVVTFTSCTGVIAATSVITIEIGTNATFGVAGGAQIENGDAGANTIALGGTMTDSGDIVVSIIADDSVEITATVDESLTFTISDIDIEFGTLSSSAVTYADASGGNPADTVAHDLTVATNATGGYIVSYNGPTLTSGGDTIDVAASIATGGTPGSEQFAMAFETDGDATITAAYYHDTPLWTYVASTTTTIIQEAGPTATETFGAHYQCNIAGDTEAGAYSTDVTYVATATF